MSEIIVCDKCSRCIDDPADVSDFSLNVLDKGIWMCYKGHLCSDCVIKFKEWLNEGEK